MGNVRGRGGVVLGLQDLVEGEAEGAEAAESDEE